MIARRDDGLELSTDPDRLDLDRIHHWLSSDAYWALGRSRETMARAVAASLNFGGYAPDGAQVAYARVVTDLATFAWLCDVYVDRGHRGLGVGTWMVGAVRDHLAPYRMRRVLLATLDAHEVYSRVGFVAYPNPERLMQIGE